MDIKKGKCKLCGEIRILDSLDRCIFCTSDRKRIGKEIKVTKNKNIKGKELKNKHGDYRTANAWMR